MVWACQAGACQHPLLLCLCQSHFCLLLLLDLVRRLEQQHAQRQQQQQQQARADASCCLHLPSPMREWEVLPHVDFRCSLLP